MALPIGHSRVGTQALVAVGGRQKPLVDRVACRMQMSGT